MPGGDGTGPMGQGSRTGRGMGNVPPSEGEKRSFSGFGRGLGRGIGRGRGFGRGLGRMMPWNRSGQNSDSQEN